MDFLQRQRLDDLFFEADALIREKRITEAFSILESILIEAPDYGKAYNHLGWIYDTHYREYAKAVEMYRKCMTYTPEYTAVYLNMSITLSTLGLYEDQRAVLEQALTVPGIDKPGIFNELAIMHELLGNYDEAISKYKEAARLSLINANIDTYVASIERCRRKQTLHNL
jgi:tetratricopeptide (TPR) repeat protein